MKNHSIRRTYLINRNLQLRFSFTAFILILASTLGVWILMHLIAYTAETGTWPNSTRDLGLWRQGNWLVIGFIIADAIAVFILSIFFSHHVAGPVHRVEMALNDLLANEENTMQGVQLRKND